MVRESILQLGLGKSFIIPANIIKLIILPFVFSVTAEFKDIKTLQKEVAF